MLPAVCRPLRAVGSAVAVVIATAGCFDAERPPPLEDAQWLREAYVETPAIATETREQRRLLRRALAELPRVTTAGVRIRAMTQAELEQWRTPPGYTLDFTTRASSRWPDDVRQGWEQTLVAGRFIALARELGQPVPSGFRSASGSGPITAAWPPAQRMPHGVRPIEILAEMRAVADEHGLRVLEAWAAPFPAAVAVLQAPEAATFLREDAAPLLAAYRRAAEREVAIYIAIVDRDGELAWAVARLPGEEAVFALPEYEACNPLPQQGTMYGHPPLPCGS
jgi:hypothetical protein